MSTMNNLAPQPAPTSTEELRMQYLETADRIGYNLCRDAVWSGDRCNWLGWVMDAVGNNFQPVYMASPPLLYNGIAGIGLFLAQLVQFTNDRHHKAILQGTIKQILATKAVLDRPESFGFYTGLSGTAYTLVRIGELTDDESLIASGISLFESPSLRSESPITDTLSGYAGSIVALIDIAERLSRPELLEIANHQAAQLMNAAHEDGSGIWWPSPISQQGLTGYSHGVAGIGLALLELNKVAPDPRLKKMADGAFDFERKAFNASIGNWPDYRPDPTNPSTEPKYTDTWCNGATGIGLSRLRALQLLPDDSKILPEINAAIQVTINTLMSLPLQPTVDFSYCHGIASHAEFLLEAGHQFDRPDLLGFAEKVGQNGIQFYHQTSLPWQCGVPGAGETPGFMLGTSGIGYFFLRLYDFQSVPSMLVLRPSSSKQAGATAPAREVPDTITS